MSWTRERWLEIESIFLDAAREQPADRPVFLSSACGSDTELRAAVERLLAADSGADRMLDGDTITALRGDDPLLQQQFGAFRLIERIAEGGMGTVYRAERVVGDFAQSAAVKVLRLALAGERARERFARERCTLARLVHPNVGRLLEGGTTPQGVPYIAMELIDGLPIDQWCDARQASVRARLALFATVCRAVHFAHQNLVVHLDLKPGNILVDRHGVPKLVDFGVAGLVVDAVGAAAVTRGGPNTPEYASPEQLSGAAVSTASDVYALGVVFFELLTGTRPFSVAAGNTPALARAVCETEATRPSAAFAGADSAAERAARGARAELRAGTAPALHRQLRGDLDRIALKALRREPWRRYASCQEFADDIERYLRGFPVTAREPSVGYRLSRFVRRNRIGVAAAAVALGSLIAGAVFAETERRRAVQEMQHADVEAQSSRIAASFLGDIFLSAEFVDGVAARARLAAIVGRRAAQVRRQYAGSPHLLANLLDALAGTAVGCEPALAEQLIDEALAIRRVAFGERSLEVALSLGSRGRFRHGQGHYAEAAADLRDRLQLQTICAPGVHTDVAAAANDLAAVERALGNRAEARTLHERALALRRLPGGDPVLVAESLNNLANCTDDRAAARAHLHAALAIRAEVLGDDDPLTIQSRINLARAHQALGDRAAALPLLGAAIAAGRRLGTLGAEGLAQALATLALVEMRTDGPAARAALDEAIAIDRQRLPADHPLLIKHQELWAAIAAHHGDAAAAVTAARAVLDARRATLPHGHPEIRSALVRLGAYLNAAGDVAAAVPWLEEALTLLAADPDHRPLEVAEVKRRLADSREHLGDLAAAERLLREALASYAADPSQATAAADVSRRLRELLRQGPPAGARPEAPGK